MPKKIFELAKELDMGAIELVEKLRSMGLNVRNHMATLSDEEVEKATAKVSGKKTGAKKGTKKKKTVVKKAKKVVKKVVAKKAQTDEPVAAPVDEVKEAAPAEEKSDDKGKAKKVVTIRRKATKTKKITTETPLEEDTSTTGLSAEGAGEGPEVQGEEQPAKTNENNEETAASSSKSLESEKKTSTFQESGSMPGLRVVFQPPAPDKVKEKRAAELAAEAEKAENPEDLAKKKEYLVEKMHTFTPIFVPPEKAKPKAGEEDSPGGEGAAGKEETQKKRMGGLAQMVSKVKAKSPVRDITKVRADEELKSYAALGLLGKNIYSQVGRKKIYSGPSKKTIQTEVKESKRVVAFHDVILAKDLANRLGQKFQTVMNYAMEHLNLLLRENDFLGIKLAGKIAELYQYRVENRAFDEEAAIKGDDASSPAEESKEKKKKSKDPTRDPVVAVMGHVDHGKTTLLDSIRRTKVVSGEAGGITQHIGAYSVEVRDGKGQVTFLDTPGHAAFANIRERGANVTDMVVLVVAADDGVMPQTRESIQFCQNANVPIIVAVNKVDKEEANPDRVKQELVEYGLTPEDWGGDTQFVEVSALKDQGIEALLESLALQAEMMELTAPVKGKAAGAVIESKIESGRGPVCTVLVQSGTVKKGDVIVVGETYGRARSLMDYKGAMLKEAGPSCPVQILGLNAPPQPGDQLNVVKNEREAKKIVSHRAEQRKLAAAAPSQDTVSLEDFFGQAPSETGEKKILKTIVRADVMGSYEAIKQALESLGNSEVGVEVIAGGTGAITDSDVLMAASSQGIIFGFNMRPVTSARRLAEEKGVEVKTYSIIYDLINDVTLALEGMLAPERIEKYIGRAEVREVFSVPKIGTIAGSAVIDGKIMRGCSIRLLRDGKIVFDGNLSSLKRFKDDVKEVKNGYECGIALENYQNIAIKDIFEAYVMEERKRALADEAPAPTL